MCEITSQFIKIRLNFVYNGMINNKSELVQVMTWHLNQWWSSSMTRICVTSFKLIEFRQVVLLTTHALCDFSDHLLTRWRQQKWHSKWQTKFCGGKNVQMRFSSPQSKVLWEVFAWGFIARAANFLGYQQEDVCEMPSWKWTWWASGLVISYSWLVRN